MYAVLLQNDNAVRVANSRSLRTALAALFIFPLDLQQCVDSVVLKKEQSFQALSLFHVCIQRYVLLLKPFHGPRTNWRMRCVVLHPPPISLLLPVQLLPTAHFGDDMFSASSYPHSAKQRHAQSNNRTIDKNIDRNSTNDNRKAVSTVWQ